MNPPIPYQDHVKFKKLRLFFLASSALIIAGYLVGNQYEWGVLLFLIYCNLTGVFLVYRLNDCIDQDAGLKLNIKHFFDIRIHQLITLQLFLVLIPIAFITLSWFSISILAVSALLGMFYSLSFTFNQQQFRIKNVFILKNVLIGLAWGSLVLIGAGNVGYLPVMGLFYFTSIQVMVGSMIRDVPDLEKDRLHNVNSFPVVIGIPKTISLMHFLNVVSLVMLTFFSDLVSGISLFGPVVLWRLVNLELLRSAPMNKNWSQLFNLMTCILIFILTLILHYGGTI